MSEPTAEQIAEFKEAFGALDHDGSGFLEVKEVQQLFQRLGKNPSETQLKAMVSRADDNGDGKISFDEFCRMMVKPDKFITFEHELKEAFSVFDKDKNGTISTSELLRTMQDLGQILNDDQIAMIMKEADLDGSGTMDFNEFVRVMMY
jgi:calmodulin